MNQHYKSQKGRENYSCQQQKCEVEGEQAKSQNSQGIQQINQYPVQQTIISDYIKYKSKQTNHYVSQTENQQSRDEPENNTEKFESSIYECFFFIKDKLNENLLKQLKSQVPLDDTKEKIVKQDESDIYGYIKIILEAIFKLLSEQCDYEIHLQKLEAEVRQHIRVEQQLRLYLENTQQKQEEFEKLKQKEEIDFKDQINEMQAHIKEFDEQIKMYNWEIDNLKKELAAKEELYKIQSDKIKIYEIQNQRNNKGVQSRFIYDSICEDNKDNEIKKKVSQFLNLNQAINNNSNILAKQQQMQQQQQTLYQKSTSQIQKNINQQKSLGELMQIQQKDKENQKNLENTQKLSFYENKLQQQQQQQDLQPQQNNAGANESNLIQYFQDKFERKLEGSQELSTIQEKIKKLQKFTEKRYTPYTNSGNKDDQLKKSSGERDQSQGQTQRLQTCPDQSYSSRDNIYYLAETYNKNIQHNNSNKKNSNSNTYASISQANLMKDNNSKYNLNQKENSQQQFKGNQTYHIPPVDASKNNLLKKIQVQCQQQQQQQTNNGKKTQQDQLRAMMNSPKYIIDESRSKSVDGNHQRYRQLKNKANNKSINIQEEQQPQQQQQQPVKPQLAEKNSKFKKDKSYNSSRLNISITDLTQNVNIQFQQQQLENE